MRFYRLFLSLSLITFLYSTEIIAQCVNPPNGVDCTCSTATLLCTPDLLDGFTFSMSSTTNYGNIGNGGDLCPGLPDNGVPNNINWFSFIAWCSDLTMDVTISNCSAGGGFSYGVQMGLFANCSTSNGPSNAIECITEGGDACGNSTNYPTQQTFTANGLTVGNVYYFMMDGCLGSACDVSIDVIGTCGTGMIDPWTTGITGPLTTCVGNTDTYFTEDLDGAVEFYYYLDGVPLIDGTELQSISNTWNTAGTFQLCVDVSNEPCIPESDPPGQYCIDIMVCEAADAGTMALSPNTLCPGETATIFISGYTATADHDQYIIITDASGTIVQVDAFHEAAFTHDECALFNVYSYNAKTGGSIPTIGTNFPNDYPCIDNCCDYFFEVLKFEDTELPMFTSPPVDVTFGCYDELPAITPLDWTDNCMGSGQVDGTETGTSDVCAGGTIQRFWTVTDSCGNTASITQNITIDPSPIPSFLSPPADITIDCASIPTSTPDLDYTNGGVGSCLINGTVSPVSSGTADLCGGTLTNQWSVIDACGNSLDYTQTITVDPIPEAAFVNFPADVTFDCVDIPTGFPDVEYTNNESGACSIAGFAPVSTVDNTTACGGTIENTYSFTDACGRTTSQTQIVTILPPAAPVFTSTLPVDVTVSCDMIPSSTVNLDYTNSETGTCEVSGTIMPVVIDNSDVCGGSIMYSWDFTDACGTNLSHTQTITIEPAEIPTFQNPPADITVDCDNVPTSGSDLSYTNGLTGICELSGTVTSTISAFDVCVGEIVETWSTSDACGNPLMHSRIITVDPIDPILFESLPANDNITCDQIPANFPDLNYSNNSTGPCLIDGSVPASIAGGADACGGTIVVTWSAIDGCGDNISHSQTLTVDPAAAPVFSSVPPDLTLTCNSIPAGVTLNYSNNESGQCEISGTVSSIENGTYDVCGGNLVQEWTYTDDCGRTINESRNITVDPAPQASFVSLPPDITVTCDNAGSIPNTLNFTNGLNNPCLIAGTATAVISGSYDECGGQFTQTWSYTDPCMRTISYDRTVTVEPTSAPEFINPPADITLECGEMYTPPTGLNYTNGATGACEISGQVPAMVSQNGIVYTHTWEFTNPCNNEPIMHTQTVTESPFPDISISAVQESICEGESFDLAEIIVVDQNNTNISLSYYEGNPITPGGELSNTIVFPITSTIYTILATNEYGCTDEAIFSILVDEMPYAGEDGTTSICDNVTLNLYDFLGGNYEFGGAWIDQDGSGVNLDDPTMVTFSGLNPDTYNFIYQIYSGNSCPDDEANVSIVYNQLPEIVIDSAYCQDGNSFYSVALQAEGYTVVPNFGVVVDLGNGNYIIEDIPIDQAVAINFFDPINFCGDFINVNPPDCDCPNVPLPSVNNVSICEDEAPGQLIASPANGTVVNWYETETSNTILFTGNTFEVNETLPGVYTYYITSESIEFPDCESSNRIPVSLTITANPTVLQPELTYCLPLGESLTIILQDLNSQINSNPNNTFTYHNSFSNAELGEDEITEITIDNTTSVFVKVENVGNCISIIEIPLIINQTPSIEKTIIDESCLGSEDGSIEYEINPPGNYNVILNGNDYPTGLIENLATGTYFTTIINTDTDCEILDTFDILEGQQINSVLFNYTCDNAGTDTDGTDDFYILEFTFSTQNSTSTQYELLVDGNVEGPFIYGASNSINIPVNSGSITVIAQDINTGCTWSMDIGPLNPCSTNCIIDVVNPEFICDDAGTPSDPSDDFYTISFQANATNGGNSGAYDVLVNTIVEYTFTYGEIVSFNLPADNSTPSILLIDSDDPQCSYIISVPTLTSCSDQCDLNILDIELECSDNGTMDEVNDDIYTIDIEVELINGTGNQIELSFNGTEETYDLNEITFEVPADGNSYWVYISDPLESTCIDSVEIGPLVNCSSDCSLKLEYWEIACNDNDTPFDSTDDYYELFWMIQALEGSADSLYNVSYDATNIGQFLYSDTIDYNLTADGTTGLLSFQDTQIPSCLLSESIGPLSSCSDSCAISFEITELPCDNAGTNSTDEDDFFYFEILVTGTNSSDCWRIIGENETYKYDSTYLFGPFLIADGIVSLEIEDCENNLCPVNFTITPPASCSECLQIIDAGANTTIDCNAPTALLQGTVSEDGMYSWSGPSGFLSDEIAVIATEEGWYYFEVNFDDGCYAFDSVFVEALAEIPVSNAGEGGTINCLVDAIQLNGIYTSSSGNLSFEWRDSENNILSNSEDYLATNSGSYFFYVIDNETGCISAGDEVFVGLDIENPEATIFADPGNILNCVIELINLSHDTLTDVRYEWMDADGNTTSVNTFTIDSSGLYILMAIDTVTGCIGIDSIEIDEIQEFPVINSDPYNDLNCEINSVIIDASATIPFSSTTFMWTDESQSIIGMNSEIEISNSGTYYLTAIDTITGCENIDTFIVNENFDTPEISTSEDVALPCETMEANLTVNSVNSNVTFKWSTNTGNILTDDSETNVEISGEGLYYVLATNELSGCTSIDSVLVYSVEVELNIGSLEVQDETCFSESDGAIDIAGIIGGTEPYEIFVNGELTSQSLLENLEPGEYSIEIIDDNGCSLDTSITIDMADIIITESEPLINIEEGESGLLVVTTSILTEEIASIIWSPSDYLSCNDCLESTASPEENITYTITITDKNGCTSETEISIIVRESLKIYIPNVFTPDNDGINDYFTFFSPDIAQINKLSVFNRWGELMFENANFPAGQDSQGWDGRFKGQTLNGGVYVFTAEVLLESGEVVFYTGDITLIK